MGVNQYAQHAKRLVVLDETHPAHICGEIINDARIPQRHFAFVLALEVQHEALHTRKNLKPLVHRLHIDGADGAMSLAQEVGNKMAADKATGAADNDQIGFHTSIAQAPIIADFGCQNPRQYAGSGLETRAQYSD